jgi:hypothetical protein
VRLPTNSSIDSSLRRALWPSCCSGTKSRDSSDESSTPRDGGAIVVGLTSKGERVLRRAFEELGTERDRLREVLGGLLDG